MRGSDRSRRFRAPKQHEDVSVYDTVHLDDAELYEGEERSIGPVRGIKGPVKAAFTGPQLFWP